MSAGEFCKVGERPVGHLTRTRQSPHITNQVQMRPHNPIKRAKIVLTSIAARLRGRRTAHLLHIAKTGGTALKHALSGIRDGRDGLRLVLHSHKTRLIDIPRGDAVFFCCRDPISRYRSGFMSRQRQGQPRNFIPWSEGEQLAFERFSDSGQLADALGSIDSSVRQEAEIAFGRIGHVNTPLAYWLGSESLLEARRDDIVWIGLQSDLDADFARLVEFLGLPGESALPRDDVTAHRNPGKVNATLSPEGQQALLGRFTDDARLFEWCLQHRSRLIGGEGAA